MLACIATLALETSVVVLDGGMLFNTYRVVMAAHGQTRILNRIRFARAFTCYQMVALLERTPAEDACVVVLDLLSTFLDENVPASERIRLLKILSPAPDPFEPGTRCAGQRGASCRDAARIAAPVPTPRAGSCPGDRMANARDS